MPLPEPQSLVCGLIACPRCDALYKRVVVRDGEVATCMRCRHVLVSPRTGADRTVFAMSLSILILVVAAASLPLLSISSTGSVGSFRLLDLLSVSSIELTVIFQLVGLLALFLPIGRSLFLIIAIWPIIHGQTPLKISRNAFRLAEALRVWSMIEIFTVGCLISITHLSTLARVEIGQAFWLIMAVCALTLVREKALCGYSIWNALERPVEESERTKNIGT